MKFPTIWRLAMGCALGLAWTSAQALEPVPDRLVVLTFDDAVASHYSVVRPILKRYGFGATFFITEGFSFPTNKQDYMTWEQIKELHQDGFEIGNHTRDHLGVTLRTLGQLRAQVSAINAPCAQYGIARPVSFAYPGNGITPEAMPILKELGIRFARRGGAPEHPYEWGRGCAFEPGADHPLLIPSAGDARPDWTLDDFKQAADQARAGRIAVLQFHGVPDREHPWVHTRPERFEEFMRYLHTNATEMHTTLSAHPFRIELSPGQYTFTIERGKEFFAETREIMVERGMAKLTFRLRRWINMRQLGWYSGDTHNHRDPAELPNVMLAEDVNVQLDEPFSYHAWMRGLATGRSFVTTGPMLMAKAGDRWPGATFQVTNELQDYWLDCTVRSEQPLESIELIVNGAVGRRFEPKNRKTDSGAFENEVSTRFKPEGTSWLAWRCFEQRPGDQFRFAHTGLPISIDT